MGKKLFGFMQGRFGILWCVAILLSAMFSTNVLLAEQSQVEKSSKAEVVKNIQKLQIPFIANEGQVDEQVRFSANTFGGTVFVTKDGEVVYALPKHEKSEARSWASAVSSQQSAISD